jgi:hypothetical protein
MFVTMQNYLNELLSDKVMDVVILRERPGHTVYRVFTSKNSYILKWFNAENDILELQVYPLLQRCNVPTLPVHGYTRRALLLEDLQSSPHWRLASDDDMESESTGIALAQWYLHLHQAGREALENAAIDLSFLKREVDVLDTRSLESAGKRLRLDHLPAWKLAVESVDTLTSIYRSLPHTFNYNDFAAENLALSQSTKSTLRAVVFDYDCFGLGLVYSDWRNVTYSLKGRALEAFAHTYGEINQAEKLIDEPLSILYNLVVACSRQTFPEWAKPSIHTVTGGGLERQIRRALEKQ